MKYIMMAMEGRPKIRDQRNEFRHLLETIHC